MGARYKIYVYSSKETASPDLMTSLLSGLDKRGLLNKVEIIFPCLEDKNSLPWFEVKDPQGNEILQNPRQGIQKFAPNLTEVYTGELAWVIARDIFCSENGR